MIPALAASDDDGYKTPMSLYKTWKIKKIEKIENFGDGPGCFGECRGVIPEYFYGIFEEF